MKKALKQLFCLFLVLISMFFTASCVTVPNTPKQPDDEETLGEKHNALTVEGAVNEADAA